MTVVVLFPVLLAGMRAAPNSDPAYRARFDFPFIICARENKKQAILNAFPRRLQNPREAEIATALAEIYKIARLRLSDAITE